MDKFPDHTPVIIGAGQFTEHLGDTDSPPLSSPMQVAAKAAGAAIADAGVDAAAVDTVAMIRLFADSAPAWKCPFGGSDNPPESVARRIGAEPSRRIYSNAGGSQPLQLLAELFSAVARGEVGVALLAGAEAIANQRFAQRNGLTLDWSESFDLPLDDREYRQRFAAPQELASGMFLPAHYYSLIENCQAHRLGHTPEQHRDYMARLLAPFSDVAAANPHAFRRRAYDPATLAEQGPGNYPITAPYSKLLVAQDAVNQGAALLLTSVGRARELAVPPQRWIFLQGYGEGADQFLMQRRDPARSEAMMQVLQATLDRAAANGRDMALVDVYSCFPCAVEAAREALGLPLGGDTPLTVTGGLPFFGGPGNNYSMHALAEMAVRLRGGADRGLVTANGGILSKHAAAVLAATPVYPGAEPIDWREGAPYQLDGNRIPALSVCDEGAGGRVVSYTVIARRDEPDIGVVLGETAGQARFLAHTLDPAVTDSLWRTSPIDREVRTTLEEGRLQFAFAD